MSPDRNITHVLINHEAKKRNKAFLLFIPSLSLWILLVVFFAYLTVVISGVAFLLAVVLAQMLAENCFMCLLVSVLARGRTKFPVVVLTCLCSCSSHLGLTLVS